MLSRRTSGQRNTREADWVKPWQQRQYKCLRSKEGQSPISFPFIVDKLADLNPAEVRRIERECTFTDVARVWKSKWSMEENFGWIDMSQKKRR